jgi:ribosomal protein L37E
MTTQIVLEIEEHCERCGKKAITEDGVCQSCGFKCWHAFH